MGGQGLNLCWRDVEGLLHAVERGGSAATIARRYGTSRWLDVLQVGGYHRGEINFELKALIFYNIFNALNNKSLQKKLREQCLFGSSKKVQILTSRRISRRGDAHVQLLVAHYTWRR